MTQREAFEAWYVKAYHHASLEQVENGCYLNLGAGMAWDAWTAAQAQAAVEPVKDTQIASTPVEANNDEVICPNCCNQFRAIPVNVQEEISALHAEIDDCHKRMLPAVEPVAYRLTQNRGNGKTEYTYETDIRGAYLDNCLEITKLYTSPPDHRAIMRAALEALTGENIDNFEQYEAWNIRRVAVIAAIKESLK